MKVYDYKDLSSKKLEEILKRPAIKSDDTAKIVWPILNDIKNQGDSAVIKFAKKYDDFTGKQIKISNTEISRAAKKISLSTKNAIDIASDNIEKFHLPQKPKNYTVETTTGIKCTRKFQPIESVGLYIPGGSAVLISTMLMLGIPAKIAGCKRVVVCSPTGGTEINPALAYAVHKCNISEFYSIGGAQAVGMLAYGTETFAKVDKIFGPGNQFVTSAKTLVSIDPDGCPIDMPAGPSEVLIIADEFANASFVAADLLSQAEHGADSHVILLTRSEKLKTAVLKELDTQLTTLPRKYIAEKSLTNSVIIKVPGNEKAIELSNKYSPEHLIINTKKPETIVGKIVNAGSVFIGEYSPESVGDYASGTNHSLPTYGYAKSYSGLNVEAFMKAITYQKLSKVGLKNISQTVINLAETEKLQAHANAVKIRLSK